MDFPTNGQAKELPIATWKRLWKDAPRTKPFSAKQSREPLFPRDITNPQICHPRSFGTFKRELSNQHHTIIISVSTWVNIWAPYHDTTLFQKEWSYPREAIPGNLAAQFLFRPLPVCEARRSHVHKNIFCTKAMLWVNKWSTQWSFHSNTQHVTLPNWEYIADNLQLHNLWARTSQRRVLS